MGKYLAIGLGGCCGALLRYWLSGRVYAAFPGSDFPSGTLAVNLIGGGVIVFVIFGVVAAILDFETWTAIAGVTIWFKFFADYIVSRHAHPIVPRRKKLEEAGQGPKI